MNYNIYIESHGINGSYELYGSETVYSDRR